jgi:hypothetical protein
MTVLSGNLQVRARAAGPPAGSRKAQRRGCPRRGGGPATYLGECASFWADARRLAAP